jgi:hypothetical protein
MPPLEVHYYETASGRGPITEFLDDLPNKAAAKCVAAIDSLRSGEIGRRPNAREHYVVTFGS